MAVKLRADIKKTDDEVTYVATATVNGSALFNFINDGYGCMPSISCSATTCAELLEAAGIRAFEVFAAGPNEKKVFCWPPKEPAERDAVLRLALTDFLEQFSFDLGGVKRANEQGIDSPGWEADDPLVVAAVAKATEADGKIKPIRRGWKRSYIVPVDDPFYW